MFPARRRKWRGLCGVAIAVMALAAGCQQYASYPPVEVTAKWQRPTAEPVPTIIAQTIQHVRSAYSLSDELPLNLPEGMPTVVYDKVFTHLGGGQPMQVAGEAALHIVAVRTRGAMAQVDVMYPTPAGFYGFSTFDLERQLLEPWHVTEERQWAPMHNTPPGPHYSH